MVVVQLSGGGAIAVVGTSGSLTVRGGSFTGNTANVSNDAGLGTIRRQCNRECLPWRTVAAFLIPMYVLALAIRQGSPPLLRYCHTLRLAPLTLLNAIALQFGGAIDVESGAKADVGFSTFTNNRAVTVSAGKPWYRNGRAVRSGGGYKPPL